MALQSLIQARNLLFDGGMGALMAARGIVSACPELANVEHMADITQIHADYIDAGANVITTNSFGANAIKLARYGLQHRVAELNRAAVAAARQASAGSALIALDIGPTGGVPEPYGELPFERIYAAYREQVQSALPGQPDLIIIETLGSLLEAKAAALAARESGLPFIVSFTFGGNGRTLMGETPEICALTMAKLGAAMIAANCSSGPEQMLPVVKGLLSCGIPVLAQPNAGLPQIISNQTVYPYDAPTMAPLMQPIIDAGVSGIGGCCGTTPAHIAAFSALLPLVPIPTHEPEQALCSSRSVVPLSKLPRDIALVTADDAYMAEGEVLMFRAGDIAPDDAVSQLNEIITMTAQPIILDSSREDTLIAMLRVYPGIPGVVSKSDDALTLAYCCG